MEERLQEILLELQKILEEIKSQAHLAPTFDKPLDQKAESLDEKLFFDRIRPMFRRLGQAQVEGIQAKLAACRLNDTPLSHTSYVLATSYHETAQRMQPVREGLNASDSWRRRNLRYYPYYGRGDVQLTWLANYKRADDELNLNGALLKNLDLALDPDISAKVLVRGMTEGWFTGKKMIDYLPVDREATRAEFRRCRRVVNIMDKADLIAGYAIKFQHALKEAGYGVTNPR